MRTFHALLEEHMYLELTYDTPPLPLEIIRKGWYEFHADVKNRKKKKKGATFSHCVIIWSS